jgi:hypothetical protein
VSLRPPGEGDPPPPKTTSALNNPAPNANEAPPAPGDPDEEAFFAAALRRIPRHLFLLTLALLPVALLRYGPAAALGFVAGAFVSWLSFRSLSRGVESLAERVINAHSKERGGVIVARFLLRYLLVGVIAYGIFKGSAAAFRGFLWGLTLPVGALLLEAGYEGLTAFRR